MVDKRRSSSSRVSRGRSTSPGRTSKDQRNSSREGARGEVKNKNVPTDIRRNERGNERSTERGRTRERNGGRERERERERKEKQSIIDGWLAGMDGGKKDSPSRERKAREDNSSPLTPTKQHFRVGGRDYEYEERVAREAEEEARKARKKKEGDSKGSSSTKKRSGFLDGAKKLFGLNSDPTPPWREEERDKRSTSRNSRDKREHSRGRQPPPPPPRSNERASRDQASRQTSPERGTKSRDPSRDSQRNPRDNQRKTSPVRQTPEQKYANYSGSKSIEYGEAFCQKCGTIVYLDPRSGLVYHPQPPPPEEICPHCGKPWPRNQALPRKLMQLRDDRILNSRFKNVFCRQCAYTDDPRSRYVDAETQVYSRDLDTAPPEEATEDEFRLGHYCKRVEIVRTEDGVQEPKFVWEDILRPKGRKRALLIGINYHGQKGQLRGCADDVNNMKDFLKSNGYKDRDIDILVDSWDNKPPTKKKIISHMQELVRGAESGDSLFIHYSGHGGQIPDEFDGDERDGKDECIYPVDHKRYGPLRDDQLYDILADLPKDAHLTAIFDSCHSGSVLDLPYMLDNDAIHQVQERKVKRRKMKARVILWSGCLDTQTSADATISGRKQGAMSYSFIEANRRLQSRKERREQERQRRERDKNHAPGAFDYTYSELLRELRDVIRKKGFKQRPQLSSSQALEPDEHLVYI